MLIVSILQIPFSFSLARTTKGNTQANKMEYVKPTLPYSQAATAGRSCCLARVEGSPLDGCASPVTSHCPARQQHSVRVFLPVLLLASKSQSEIMSTLKRYLSRSDYVLEGEEVSLPPSSTSQCERSKPSLTLDTHVFPGQPFQHLRSHASLGA